MKQYKLKVGKTAEKVTKTYKSIEDTFVGAYKTIEKKFVNTFLEEVDETKDKSYNTVLNNTKIGE
ncbi:MAG: hypothetical protein ACK5LL_06230 [Suipraeoptans sp.]